MLTQSFLVWVLELNKKIVSPHVKELFPVVYPGINLKDVQETRARLIATHNEGGHVTALLAQYTKKNGDKDALIAAIVTAYKAEITKLKDGDFAGELSVSGEPKAKIKTEMRLFQDICGQNIRGCSVLESEESINLELFNQILSGVSEKCPLVYECRNCLFISNPRSRNILKSNTHKFFCGLQTLGFMSNIRNSKTRNCFPLMFGLSCISFRAG